MAFGGKVTLTDTTHPGLWAMVERVLTRAGKKQMGVTELDAHAMYLRGFGHGVRFMGYVDGRWKSLGLYRHRQDVTKEPR